MSENTPTTTKLCPKCGTRLNATATKCSVCGTAMPNATVSKSTSEPGKGVAEVTLSLPVLIGLAVLLLAIGAGLVFAVLQSLPRQTAALPLATVATPSATLTLTATMEFTPTDEIPPTPAPTWTLEPPIEYVVVANDSCLTIAYTYGISVNALVQANALSPDCILSVGKALKIPRPTITPSPQPTNTLNPTEQAQLDCPKIEYIVKAGDTLGGIAANYAVTNEAIRTYSGLVSDIVQEGAKLVIPLCEQSLEAPTATPIPPYGAPNLLLPADGTVFGANDVVALQWASVGELRPNESYAVTLVDATDGGTRRPVQYVNDNKLSVPVELRPTGDAAHIFYWTVMAVRQVSTDAAGAPVYEPAGEVSPQRTFSWMGGPAPVPTPQP